MKVVVSVQAKRSSSRGLVHYIATSKVDPLHESAGRSLFTSLSDELTVREANSLLSSEVSRRRVANDDLHHLVLSLRKADFDRLGTSAGERTENLRGITRATLAALAQEIGTDDLKWVAAVHLNTHNPHVHVALHKNFFDRELNRQRLARIPPKLLPHYERQGDAKVFVAGRLAIVAEHHLNMFSQSAERSHKITEIDGAKHTLQPDSHLNDPTAAALARAIVAQHRLREAEHKLDLLTREGQHFRFRVTDPETGKRQFVSLAELEQRRRTALLRQLNNPSMKVRDQSVPPGETQIKVILRRMTEVGRRDTEARRAEYSEALAPVDEIRRELRKNGQKLPLPAFAPGELETIQTAAIERGDYRLAGYLERVRVERAARGGGSDARSTDEIGRLKGRLLISELRARSFVDQRAELHLRSAQYEHDESGRGSKPAGLAALMATVTAKLTGRRKTARQVQLDELKTEISHRLKERDNGLFNAIAAENKRTNFLSRMLRDDPSAGKDGIAEILTGAELSESEAIGRRLLLPEVVRQSWELQKTVLARDETTGRDNLLAGRAVARKILADADLAETKDKCRTFNDRRHFTRVPVATADSGVAMSLNDIGIKPHAPVLDQALDFFIVGSERNLIRQQIESALGARHDALTARIELAGQIARDASRDAAPFIRKNLLRNPDFLAAPVFTRQEIIRLEQRAARTDNAREARFLREVLGNPETRVIRNLEAILENRGAPAQQPASHQPHHHAEINLTTGEKMHRRNGL